MVEGESRARLLRLWQTQPFLQGQAELLPEQPARSTAMDPGVWAASASGVGKARRPPGSSSPHSAHSRATMPRMRGMLLFWLIKKVHSTSKKGWRSTRSPGAAATHSARRLLPANCAWMAP